MTSSHSRPHAIRLWHRVVPPLTLGLLALGFALVPLSQGRFFFYWDNAQQHYPQTVFLHQALKSLSIPQWWPGLGLGFPTTAEGQAAHYQPLRLLLAWVLSPPAALMWEIGLCLAIAGIGTYLFLRELRLSPAASFVGGVCQMFGSFSVIFIRNLALHRSLSWLPLGMLFTEAYVRRGQARYLLGLSLVIGLQLLGGHPTFALVTIIATATYLVCRMVQVSWHKADTFRGAIGWMFRRAVLWGLGIVLGFGIGAIQVLPTLKHTEQSIRQGGLSFEYAVNSLSADFAGLAQAFFPYAYQQGDWLEVPTWWGSDFNEVPYTGFYVGALPVVLAFVALWWWRGWPSPTSALLLCTVVGTAFALGSKTPFFPALWSLPGLHGMRYPARFLMWSSFSVSCLAAVGLHRLLAIRRLRARPERWALPIFLFGGLVLFLGWAFWARKPEFRSGVLLSLLLFAVAIILVGSLLLTPRRFQFLLLAFACLFVLVDLGIFRTLSSYAPAIPVREALSPPATALARRSEPDPYRVLTLVSLEEGRNRNEELRQLLQADLCTVWGINSADVWFSLVLRRYYALRESLVWELRNHPEKAAELAGVLGAMNVKFLVTPDPIALEGWEKAQQEGSSAMWRNPRHLPRAFLVGDVVPENLRVRPEWTERASRRLGQYRAIVADWWSRREEAQILDHILDRAIDYGHTAVVAGRDLPALSGLGPDAHVRELAQGPDTMKFEVQTSRAAFLVVSNSDYPGWTATVEGKPVLVYRTNWVTQGVFVPAGRSTVVFRFVTPGFRLGAGVTLLSLLLLAALWWWSRSARGAGWSQRLAR